MSKLNKILIFLLLGSSCFAATPITVSGTLQVGSSTGLKGNAFVRFRLRNYAGFVPRIASTAILAQTQFDVKPTDALGNFSTSIYSNDDITPNTCGTGTEACTWWTMEYWNDGKVTASGNYCIPNTSPTYNINSASPCQTPPLPPSPSSGGSVISGLTLDRITKAASPTSITNSALYEDGTSFGNVISSPRQLVWGNFACSSLNANVTNNAGCTATQNSITVKSANNASTTLTRTLNIYYEGNGQQGTNLYGAQINAGFITDANSSAAAGITGLDINVIASGNNVTIPTLYGVDSRPRLYNNAHVARMVYYHGSANTAIPAGTTVDLLQGVQIGTTVTGTVTQSTGIGVDRTHFRYGFLASGSINAMIVDDADGVTQSGVCHGVWDSTFMAISSHDCWYGGTGAPEGVVTANIGSIYSRQDGSTGTSLYVKESGTGNTGWAGLSDVPLINVVGPPAGVQYPLGGGLYWQVDATHLTWNSGVTASSSGNVVIANTFAAGASNNAGGIQVKGAPATGSACAGDAQLLGGDTNGAANNSKIASNGACSNGFGAIGGSITLTAGSTAASNSGGDINLNPGTGGFANGAVKVTQSLVINNGTPVKKILSSTATLDFGNLAAIGCEDLTVTVTGAAVGDTVSLGVPNGSVPSATFTYTAWVSSANTVTIRGCTLVSGDPASGSFRATVVQF